VSERGGKVKHGSPSSPVPPLLSQHSPGKEAHHTTLTIHHVSGGAKGPRSCLRVVRTRGQKHLLQPYKGPKKKKRRRV
jgi:hypothetical protein